MVLVAIERYEQIPAEEKQLSYVPTLKKQLREQEKKLAEAKSNFDRAQKELNQFISKQKS